MLKRLGRSAIGLGLRNDRVRRVVAAELRKHSTRQGVAAADGRSRVAPPAERRTFVDRHGVAHQLDPGHRDRLKPGWRAMVDPEMAGRPPTDAALVERTRRAAATVQEARAVTASLTGTPLAGRILEVGCYDGAMAFQLATIPGSDLVASDMARYYVVQRPGSAAADEDDGQQASLDKLRERAAAAARAPVSAVRFVEDDLIASRLPDGTFDAVVSFEVLEHVREPATAFASVARLLRPGGIGYHDYNPFISIIGGHSLCTLDFPWGHARLDDEDVERYLAEIRPSERDQALRFYRDSLNRMTLADLRVSVATSGLELIALLPWADRSRAKDLAPEVLAEVRRNYRSATVEDLLATFVTVIVRRPVSSQPELSGS